MTLELTASVAQRDLDLSLEVADREVVAVLGPNGAGKSTVLSIVAGLLRPDRGRASLDERVIFDVGTDAADIWVAPHRRGVSLMAQEPLLFPHLTALDNVAFGPRSNGHSRRDARRIGRRWLAEVDAGEYADRKPGQLSGGQAQRIAVARALAADPRLLLLDEPMAALDVSVAPELRQMLRRVLADRSAVIVTHDVLDALLLADRVIVIEGGRIVEEGPTAQVLSRPRSGFGARVAGLNMVRGTFDGHGVRTANGMLLEGLAEEPVPNGDRAVALFRPGAVGVHLQPPGGSPRNVIDVTITHLEPHGDHVRVRAADFSADVTPGAVAELHLAPRKPVFFAVKATEVAIYRA
jgi:molybdate transport system ATP-binding protein